VVRNGERYWRIAKSLESLFSPRNANHGVALSFQHRFSYVQGFRITLDIKDKRPEGQSRP